MKKKHWLIAGAGVIFLSAIAFLIIKGPRKSAGSEDNFPSAQPTPVPTKPIEQTIQKRPFVSLIPTADGHWVNLEIKNIAKEVTALEYDLIYFADAEGIKIERGVSTGGIPVELKGASEYSKKILFGSASCTTGVCKYHYDENVSEGSFVLAQTGWPEKYEAVFRIQKGAEAKEGLTAGDGHFLFVSSKLAAKSPYLTTQTIGVPKPLPDGVTPKSEPYGIFPAITVAGEVAFQTTLNQADIYGFNGRVWQKLTTEVIDGQAKASSSGQYLFILAQ